ncbi:MAG: hypothetical protein ABI036_15015 [Fibrobacteria bacterium]
MKTLFSNAGSVGMLSSRYLYALLIGVLTLAACDSGTGSGPVTDPDAELLLLAPIGGEKLFIGDTLRVKWALQGKGVDEVNAVNVLLSPDSGVTWINLTPSLTPVDPNWAKFPWLVQESITHLGISHSLKSNAKILFKIMQYSTADANKIAVTKKTLTIASK